MTYPKEFNEGPIKHGTPDEIIPVDRRREPTDPEKLRDSMSTLLWINELGGTEAPPSLDDIKAEIMTWYMDNPQQHLLTRIRLQRKPLFRFRSSHHLLTKFTSLPKIPLTRTKHSAAAPRVKSWNFKY